MDTGYHWLRITHILTAKIAATDIVTFQLAFQSDYDPWTDPAQNLILDAG